MISFLAHASLKSSCRSEEALVFHELREKFLLEVNSTLSTEGSQRRPVVVS